MATIVTNLTCELTGAVQVKVLQGNLFSADNGGNTINVYVTNNGEPAALGGTISANVIRGDGTTVAVSGAIDGNRAYIILPQACYAIPGVIQIIIKNTESSTVTTIAAVVANVYESTTDTVVDPGTIIPSVAALVEAIEDAVAEIPAGYNACFAPAYSTSSTYDLGQYVTYNGYLYRCTTAITSSESWTAAHWTQVALANDVSALKSAFEALEDLTTVTDETTTTTNIYSGLTWTDGYMGTAGTTGTASNLHYSNKIAVTEGDIIAVAQGSQGAIRFVTAFSGDTPVSASGAENAVTYTVPEGIDGVILTTYIPTSQYAPTGINYTHTTRTTKNILDDDVAEMQSDITDIKSVIQLEDYTEYEELNTTPTFTTGGINIDGTTLSYTSFEYTQKIQVIPGDVIEALGNGVAKNMRWICAYAGSNAVSSSGSSSDTKKFTVPDGIDGLIITTRISDDVDTIHITTHSAETSAYIKQIHMGYMAVKGTLADGENLTLPYQNCKINNCYVFYANITTFGSITFSKEASAKITVDNTNITIQNDQTTITVAHGLTIGSSIMLMVQNEASVNLSLVRLESDGVIFDYTTATRFIMDTSEPKITSTGSTLTDCVFSWVSKNINAPIWIFGDSYLSWYAVRWTYYLAQDGYTKDCLLNGFAGQASATAYTALVNLLGITTPKMVVWCLGMNDPDSESAVSASWYEYYQRVVELQKKYGFELVLYTVPSTPTMNNSYKDAIIRSSDFRYIEADKAVRIDAQGNWIAGALDEDNVHPTAIGAKILYCRILADLPELMSNY